MKTCKEMVTEFHRLNGSVIDAVDPGPEVAVVRTRLMIEEFAETYEALHENNVIEAADGLADLLYVIYGTAVAYGVECHDSFTTPLHAPAAAFDRKEIADACRMLLPMLTRACVAVIMTPRHCGPALNDLADAVNAAAWSWGLPMREIFEDVHRSNITKTFSPATNTAGGKYGQGINHKGPGYSPPDIADALAKAREAFNAGPTGASQTLQDEQIDT